MRTSAGEELQADLVIDCSGRRSALPSWLEALGARPPVEEVEDSGFIYLGRHFRSRDGELPFALGPLLQSYGSISVLTLPADNGTWSVTLVARSGDRALLGLKDMERWESVVRSLPTVAHWIEGDPIEDRIITMAKIEDRHRELRPDGVPVATGVLAVADAWACTNPSVGRGASIGMLHAQALRDTLRQTGPDRPAELSEAFAVATADTVEPWFQATLAFDRHRLAEMAAEAEGASYEPDDPAYEMTRALGAASGHDPDVLRGFLDITGVLDLPENVMARPGMSEKVIEFGADWRDAGADRTEQGRARRPGHELSVRKTGRRSPCAPSSGGASIEYEVTGEGRPVVLLHGFPDSGRLWRHQIAPLADAGFKVIVPDMRGYGASDKPTEVDAYNILYLVADVGAVLDDVGVERAHVVGHDWGAAVAWALAAMVPDRVDHLVALSVGHPATFRAGGYEQHEKSWYMLLFQFPGIAEQWLSNDGWANFRDWAGHPDADAVIAEVEANGSLTPALNWYRANIPPSPTLRHPVSSRRSPPPPWACGAAGTSH